MDHGCIDGSVLLTEPERMNLRVHKVQETSRLPGATEQRDVRPGTLDNV